MALLASLTTNQARIRQLEAERHPSPYYDIIIDFDNRTSRMMATGSDELSLRRSYEGFLTANYEGPKPIRMRLWMNPPLRRASPVMLEEHTWAN